MNVYSIKRKTKWEKMKIKKVVKISAIILLSAFILILSGILLLWHNEISTVLSIKELRPRNDAHLDGAVYEMHVSGGYYFDDFIKQGGASNDADLLKFISDHITKGLASMGYKTSKVGCSSFTAKTPDGDQLFGRNYDMTQTNTCIVFTKKSKKRHATVSSVDLQYLGIAPDRCVKSIYDKILCIAAPYAPLDGMNDAGLSCAIYMSYQGCPKTVETNQQTEKPDITSTTMLRLILDYANDVDEAIELVKQYDLHDSAECSFHYMIADKTGRSAVIEWIPPLNARDKTDNDGTLRELVVTYNDKDSHIGEIEAKSDFQCITNFILQPEYYELSKEDEINGLVRYNMLYNALDTSNGIVADETDGMKLLQAVGQRKRNKDQGKEINQKTWITNHSIIYNLTDKTVLWVSNENYDDENAVFRFSL